MYEIDWDATINLFTVIGTFLSASATAAAAIVAWKISEKWRHQKSSEVLANEAKAIVSDLFSFNSLIAELQILHQPTQDEINQKIQQYNSLVISIENRIAFLSFETNGDKQAQDFIAEFRNFHKWFFDTFLKPYTKHQAHNKPQITFQQNLILLSDQDSKTLRHLILCAAALARIYRDIALYRPRK